MNRERVVTCPYYCAGRRGPAGHPCCSEFPDVPATTSNEAMIGMMTRSRMLVLVTVATVSVTSTH